MHFEFELLLKKSNNLHIFENKDADQLCTADQPLCFCHTDITIGCLLISKVSSF